MAADVDLAYHAARPDVEACSRQRRLEVGLWEHLGDCSCYWSLERPRLKGGVDLIRLTGADVVL